MKFLGKENFILLVVLLYSLKQENYLSVYILGSVIFVYAMVYLLWKKVNFFKINFGSKFKLFIPSEKEPKK